MSRLNPTKINRVSFYSVSNQTRTSLYHKNLTVSDENLLALHSIFGNVLERALETILRKDSVTLYTLQNDHRSLIEVKGNNDKVYRLLPNVNYCFCPAFQNHVLQIKSEITCKHILAAYVAKLTQTINTCLVTKEQFNLLYESFVASDDFDSL